MRSTTPVQSVGDGDFEQLMSAMIREINGLSSMVYIPGMESDDIRQELFLLLFEIARTCDPTDERFRYFFRIRARNRLNDLLKIENRKALNHALSYDTPLDKLDDDSETLLDLIGSVDPEYVITEIRTLAEQAGCTPKEVQVLLLRVQGFDMKTINAMIGGREYYKSDGSYNCCTADKIMVSVKRKMKNVLRVA